MSAPDAKTRSIISLRPSSWSSSRIPSRLLPQVILSNVFFVTTLHSGKEWILDFDVGVFWLVMRVLACGGIGVIIWEGVTGKLLKRKDIEWSALGLASLLVFLQQACLFTALYRLSSIRVIMFSQFATLWLDVLWSRPLSGKGFAVIVAFSLALLSDYEFSELKLWRCLPGYVALVIYAISSAAVDHTSKMLSISLGTTFTVAACTLGATVLSLPLYLFRTMLLNFPPTPVLPLLSLALIPFLAYSLLFFSPISAQSLNQVSRTSHHFFFTFPSTLLFALLSGFLAFSQYPAWTDIPISFLLYFGMSPTPSDSFPITPHTPRTRLMKSYIKTILGNPESRKIFYFLMLNMCYMLVQMLYGVWTNSLGLISDAIHMAFDCMAIGVGLFASVMATWEPNEEFTYGYGRIETLSGFANGIFLILISIFIVFEAIQRILEPPQMNTNQLLLVSSLGLAVNLFGMFAMGGHHHHGGGHSHSHSHGHSHEGSLPLISPTSEGAHHSHSHSVSPSHSHSPSVSVSPTLNHTHSHSHSPVRSTHTDHAHFDEHAHEDHDDCHSHSHEPSEVHGHDEHSHSHSHGSSGAHDHNEHNHSHSSHSDSRNVRSLPPSLKLNAAALALSDSQDFSSPITPSYNFGHDEHYATHEHGTPNVNAPSHAPVHHEGHSHNMRGVFLHVMADTLGSVGVILSTLLIQYYGWTGFDPIASLFIAVLIAASVIPLVIDTGKVLCLDVGDRTSAIEDALSEVLHLEGLESYSEPRFWPKDATTLIGSIHIQIAPSASNVDPGGPHSTQQVGYARVDRVVERVDDLLKRKISGLQELTIQVEKGKRT